MDQSKSVLRILELAIQIFCLDRVTNALFFKTSLPNQLQFIHKSLLEPGSKSPFKDANFGGFPQLGNPEWHELYELVTRLAQDRNICCVCDHTNKDVSRATHDDEFSYDARVKGLCADCSAEGI
jgi:hypothetical protein